MSRTSGGIGGGGGPIPSRLYMTGHSYGAYNQNPYTDWLPGQASRPRGGWTAQLPSVLGISEATRFITGVVPAVAAGSDASTVIGVVPESSAIESVNYIPISDVTGANSNSRTLQLETCSLLGVQVIVNFPLTSGVNLVGAGHTTLFGPVGFNTIAQFNQLAAGTQFAFRDVNNAYIPPVNTYMQSSGIGVVPAGTPLVWKSLHVGSGIADPGGLVIIRLGGRIRNACVSGAYLVNSAIYGGGWATAANFRPSPNPVDVEVNVSANAAQNATSITVDSLRDALGSGTVVAFSNGVNATLSAPAALNATSLTVTALSGAVNKGEQGYPSPVREVYAPTAIWSVVTGLNDAGTGTAPTSAFREASRYIMALGSCPYGGSAERSNHVYVNGGGAWADAPACKLGQFPYSTTGTAGVKVFTGAATSTPSLTIKVAAAAMTDADSIDLFFYALGGSTHGAAASITVDSGNPVTGACTINTSGVASVLPPGIDVHTVTATTTNGAASLTATVGTFTDPQDIGRYVTGPGVAANTWISSVTDSTHAVLSQNAGAGAGSGSVSMIPLVPMVKRITGLTGGIAHTVAVTVTGIDATDGTAALLYAGYGLECNNPRQSVLFANIPRIPSQSWSTDANVNALNAESAAVLAGTANVVAGNSAEPAFPTSVKIIDLDTAFNKNAGYFTNDGVHPNLRGGSLIAQMFSQAVEALTFTQLASR